MKTLKEAAAELLEAITAYLVVVPDGPVARMEALRPVLDAHAEVKKALARLGECDPEVALEEAIQFAKINLLGHAESTWLTSMDEVSVPGNYPHLRRYLKECEA